MDISEPALVAHFFFSLTSAADTADPGFGPSAWRTDVQPLWDRCFALGITDPLPGAEWSVVLPERLPDDEGFRVVAAGTRAGPGVVQAVLYRYQDVLGLTVLLAPSGMGSWAELDDEWPHDLSGTLGTVRLYVGLVSGRLTPVTADRAVSPQHPGLAWHMLRSGAALAPLRDVPTATGAAAERSAVLLGRADREAALYELCWADGDRPGLQPLTRYFLNAARLRYQARVYDRDQRHYRRAKTSAEQCARQLTRLLELAGRSGAGLASRELVAGQSALLVSMTQTNGVVGALGSLLTMRRAAQGFTDALCRALGISPRDPPPTGTVPGADLALAGWLDDRIESDIALLTVVRDTAGEVSATAGSLVRDLLGAREQRVTVVQTSLLGGLVMALAAIQSFGIRMDVPGPMQTPLVFVLGALAVTAPILALRLAQWLPGVSFGPLVPWTVGGLGCCLGWLAMGWATAAGHAVTPGWTVGVSLASGALSAGGVLAAGRLRAALVSGRFRRTG
ncbi:CATRA conflict system CASPASE/TPR repeat-associated protein [Streptomyces olivaceus]|uniref:CATRA conflict system CASPASE/TPR repeat-associated protein n=1 Tax=Streptomyces TaxID=1883 RepID=UPI001FB794AB|nr:CATRA conflict system CASPASE/TPR repeat-associated protein [Streptomyces sp. CB09030]UOG82812.1 BN6_48550 family protein [Streptomyces sp. CB09030]